MSSDTSALDLVVVHAPGTAAHDVLTGVWCGVPELTDELPERADLILSACRRAGARLVEADDVGLEPVLRVHDDRMVDVLATAHDRWVADGHLEVPGNPYVIPYYFPAVGSGPGADRGRAATKIRAEIGRYALDTLTPIGAGTWGGALAAVNAAVTAARLVSDGGSPAVYAVCRPPGHHAGPAFFGGSCYLNNAAIAAADLRIRGCERVAIVDIDAHHGNGTQAIFWNDPAVLYASVHADPAAGCFPHVVGYADEVDDCETNMNVPLPAGTGDAPWVDAVRSLCAVVGQFSPDVLVVSLGVDPAVEDPNAPLMVTSSGFAVAGAALAELGLPTVLVQEGGYVPETLARHTLAVLTPFGGRGIRSG
jgi:acetoin utilization deacetylase AcuC-like enzyme